MVFRSSSFDPGGVHSLAEQVAQLRQVPAGITTGDQSVWSRFKSEAFFCSLFNFGLDQPTDSLDLADSNQSTIGFDRFIEPLDSVLGEILATSSVEGILLPFLSGINRSQRGHLNQAGGRSSHPQESVHSHRTLPHPMSHSPGCHSSMA